MYRICKIPEKKCSAGVLSGEFPVPVKHTKAKRDCRNEKVFSVPQVRQREDESHNVKDSQVCFQRILSEIKSILGSGSLKSHFWLFAMARLCLCLGQACLTLQVICLSVLHQSH